MPADLSAKWLGAIEGIDLRVDARLRAGRYAVRPSPSVAPLILSVPARAGARIDARVTGDGAAYLLDGAWAAFTPPLQIRNPKSALQPSGAVIDFLGDLFADLEVASVRVGRDGRIVPELVRRLFVFFRSPMALPDDEATRMRVPVPLFVVPATGAAVEPPAAALAMGPADSGLADLFGSAHAILDEARLALSMATRPLPLPDLPRIAPLAAGRLGVHLDAAIGPGEPGTLRFHVRRPVAPQIECDLFRVLFDGEGSLSAASGALAGEGRIDATMELREESIVLVPQPGARLPVTLQQGATLRATGGWTIGPDGLSADGVRLESNLRARLLSREPLQIEGLSIEFAEGWIDLRGGAVLADGGLRGEDLVASLLLRDPSLVLGRTPLSIAGTATASLRVQELTALTEGGRLRGALDLSIALSDLGDEGRIAKTGIPIGLAAHAGGRFCADPIEGVLDAIEPWVDLNGDVRKVRDPEAPAAGGKGSAEVRAAVERHTGAVARAGNRVELLVDGIESYPRRLALIDSARRSLCVQSLIFASDETGMEFAQRLVARARAGVKVRVIVDALGNIDPANPITAVTGHKVYDVLREGGVDLRIYNGIAADSMRELITAAGGAFPALGSGGRPVTDLRDPVALIGALGRLVQQAKAGAAGGGIEAALARLLDAGDPLMRRARLRPRAPGKSGASAHDLDGDDLLLILRQAAALNHRWHEKYLIADDHAVIMGGLNIADEYQRGGVPGALVRGRPAWRDTDVYIEGPAVLDALQSFADNWRAIADEVIEVPAQARPASPGPAGSDGGAMVQIIQHRPREDGDHHIQNALLEHITSLGPGDRAWFAHAYFVPLGGLAPLSRALAAAAGRGVDVRIVTNSKTTTDAPQVNDAAIFSVRRMLAARVRVFERTGDRTMHSKFALLGDDVVAIGSWNMDNRSESLNSEALALIQDRALAERAARAIEADMAPAVARELREADDDVRAQPLEAELRALGLCAVGELL